MVAGCNHALIPGFACAVGTLATSGDGSIYILQDRQLVAFQTSGGSYQESPYVFNVLSGHREFAHSLAAGAGSTGYILMGDKVVAFDLDKNGIHWRIPIGPAEPLDLSLAISPTGVVYASSYISRSIQVFRATTGGALSHIGAIKGNRTNLVQPGFVAVAPDGTIYVNDHGRVINVYTKGTIGNQPSVATIRVQGALGTLGPMAVDANYLYVACNSEPYKIVVLTRSRSGVVAPARSISGSSTQLGYAYAVAVAKDGRLFIANARTQEVTVYAKNANGNAAPVADLSGPATGLGNPTGLALDGRGHLIVGVGNLIRVFDENATGNAAPLLSKVVVPGLPFVSGVAADAYGRVYAVSYPTLSLFGPLAGGNMQLLARTAPSRTHIEQPQGLTVDPLGRIYVANASGEVNVFPANAAGNISPIASMGSKQLRIVPGSSMAADADGAVYLPTSSGESVVIYSHGANHVVRIRLLEGNRTQLQGGHSVAVDRVGKLYVANEDGNSITVYDCNASGNSAPIGKIQGINTGLDRPVGVAIASDGSIVVNNAKGLSTLLELIFSNQNSVVVYPAGATGNVKPKTTVLYRPLCAPQILPPQYR